MDTGADRQDARTYKDSENFVLTNATLRRREMYFSPSALIILYLRHTVLGSFPLPQQIPAINQQLKRKV